MPDPEMPTADPRFLTVHDRRLSLWQSAAEQAACSRTGDAPVRQRVLADPLVQATTAHCVRDDRRGGVQRMRLREARRSDRGEVERELSRRYFRHAEARRRARGPARVREAILAGLALVEVRLLALIGARRFGALDPRWLMVGTTYVQYWIESGGRLRYRDWRKEGGGSLGYSVVPYRLPDDAKVAIVGDWGTGMPDAEALLMQLLEEHRPDAVIHLGDIYYSGTRDECERHFREVFERCFARWDRRIPVFSIPGNHDYYDWGVGFYDLIDRMNEGHPDWAQDASYFCLRTQDGLWQLVGMDTGQGDSDPGTDPSPPALRDSEVEWLIDKLATFGGTTILLSHHQVISARSTIDPGSDEPWINRRLRDALLPQLHRVAAWFWGHEHSFALYKTQYGVPKGRLVGSSAFETRAGDGTRRYPNVQEEDSPSEPMVLGSVDGYFNHSYAVVDLARTDPAGEIAVSYHQIPSWGGDVPVLLPVGQQAFMGSERLAARQPAAVIAAGTRVVSNGGPILARKPR